MRFYISLLLAIFVCIGTEAKKVKLAKNIIYSGVVVEGTPNGEGVLTVHSLKNKGNNLITVTGFFNDNIVHNATLQIGELTISASSLSYLLAELI